MGLTPNYKIYTKVQNVYQSMRFPHKVQGLHQRIYQSKRFTPKYEIYTKVWDLHQSTKFIYTKVWTTFMQKYKIYT